MKTRLVHLDLDRFEYPVGRHIQRTLRMVPTMADRIKDLFNASGKSVLQLIVRGSSGAILAALVSQILEEVNVTIIYSRKEGERGHNGSLFGLGSRTNHFNVLLDDFMASGQTIENIVQDIEENSYCEDGIIIDALVLSDQVNTRALEQLGVLNRIKSIHAQYFIGSTKTNTIHEYLDEMYKERYVPLSEDQPVLHESMMK